MFQKARKIDGRRAISGQPQGAGQGDPVEDVLQVALGRWPGPDAGDVAALLADDVGLLVGIEGDGRVEVGEAEDQHAVEEDVPQVVGLGQVHADPVLDAASRTRGSAARWRCRIGKYSTELAKMIGTTPPVLTFIGM